MKKVLALALVLVLALGMMVPASAAANKVVDYVGFGPGLIIDEIENNVVLPYDDVYKIGLGSVTIPTAIAAGGDVVGFTLDYDINDPFVSLDDLDANDLNGNAADFITLLRATVAADKAGFDVLDLNGGLMANYKGYLRELATYNTYAKSYFSSIHKIIDKMPLRILAKAGGAGIVKSAKIKHSFTNATIGFTSAGAWVYTPASATFWIEVEYEDRYVETKKVDYDVDIYFVVDKKRTDDQYYICLWGEYGNRIEEIDNDTWEYDTWDGVVVEATEYISKIALKGNEDEDIYAHVKMANDKRIYFDVVNDGDLKDEAIFDRYPSIEWAYTVYQKGLDSYTGNFIELGGVDNDYYVYGKAADGGLKYLGRGGELLPLSAKYYISTMKLDLSSDEPVDEIPVDVPSIVDDYNPSTGI